MEETSSPEALVPVYRLNGVLSQKTISTGCISESGDFKNVMNSKLLHLFGVNTYEYSVNIKAFGFSKLTHSKQKSVYQK
jgi:hypothetical protein